MEKLALDCWRFAQKLETDGPMLQVRPIFDCDRLVTLH